MNEPQITLRGFITILAIAGFIALLGWMGERDREYKTEVARLAAMAHECGPTIELSMPIEPGRIAL